MALLTPSDYYRDAFFYKYINGKPVQGMENVPVMPSRDLSHFISLHSAQEENKVPAPKVPPPKVTPPKAPPPKASLLQYLEKHPQENSDLQTWINAHRILTKSSGAPCINGKGFDFLQEEDLKMVIKHLPRGALFDYDSFARAVRLKQNIEEFEGSKSPERGRPFEKYDTEVQLVGSIMIRNQFSTAEALENNPYHEDLLKIEEIFQKNLGTFFIHRVSGLETSSVKLDKFHFTKADKEQSEAIEKKTKKEIVKMIFELGKASWVDDEYLENLKEVAKETQKKQFLIDIYNEIVNDHLQAQLEADK